jgi:hypothetical protein
MTLMNQILVTLLSTSAVSNDLSIQNIVRTLATAMYAIWSAIHDSVENATEERTRRDALKVHSPACSEPNWLIVLSLNN